MKPLEIMNVQIKILLVLAFYSSSSFSQKKEDVYFLISKNNNEYLVTANFNKNLENITLFKRKEYEYHKKKVKEAKENGTYYYNPESGRDNLKIYVPKLIFKVISVSQIKLNDYHLKKRRIIDYEWLNKNSWKKIGKQPHDFNNIYFLYNTNKNEYISYKVDLTIVEY